MDERDELDEVIGGFLEGSYEHLGAVAHVGDSLLKTDEIVAAQSDLAAPRLENA